MNNAEMVDKAEVEAFAIAARLHTAIDAMARDGAVSSALSVVLALGHLQGVVIAWSIERRDHRLYMKCADDVRKTALQHEAKP